MINPWSLSSFHSSSGEINLREILQEFLFGNSGGAIPKGSYYIIRQLKLDDNNKPIECTCRTNVYKESPKNKGSLCRFCKGEGFLWEDKLVTGYLYIEYPSSNLNRPEPFGSISPQPPILFLDHTNIVREYDKILEPLKDSEGKLISPLKINKRYSVTNVDSMRGDNGRVEFIRVRLSEGSLYADD